MTGQLSVAVSIDLLIGLLEGEGVMRVGLTGLATVGHCFESLVGERFYTAVR